jgi:hypothetical protein
MTPAELRELLDGSLTVPLTVAFDAIGVGETAGRKAQRRGDLPFRVIAVGKALRVPAVDLERLLLTPDNSETGPATGPALALTHEPSEARSDQCAPLHAV